MVEVLEFIFRDVYTFFGTAFLIGLTGEIILDIINSFNNKNNK